MFVLCWETEKHLLNINWLEIIQELYSNKSIYKELLKMSCHIGAGILFHVYARNICSLLGQSPRSGIHVQTKLSQFQLTISSFELYVVFKQMPIIAYV